jgi:GDP-L-fucose synthase
MPDHNLNYDLGNKRIWITGGAGFLGRKVIVRFEEIGCKNIFQPSHSEVDLLKPADVSRALDEIKPNVIVHLAARVGGIGANRRLPAELFYQNAMMGLPLMHQAWRAGVEKFVALGSVCGYPKFTPVPFSEDKLWDGYPEETNAPYGLAKKMLLLQAQAYRQQYGFNSIFLLPVNLYGPGDNFDPDFSHVIPALILKFVQAMDQGSSTVTCWGDGTASREFLYVDDCAEAIVLATEKYNDSQPVNLGAGSEITIADLAALLVRLLGYQGEIKWDTSQPNGQPRRCLDTRRAAKEFGFKATTELEFGLQETIKWFLEHRPDKRY